MPVWHLIFIFFFQFSSSVMRSWSVTLSFSHLWVTQVGKSKNGARTYTAGEVRGRNHTSRPELSEDTWGPCRPLWFCCSVQSHSCASNLLLSLQAGVSTRVVGNAWEVVEVWNVCLVDLPRQGCSDPLHWSLFACVFIFIYLLINLFALVCSMQDLTSLSRDWTHVPCSGSMES